MGIVLMIHSLVRFVILILAVAGIVITLVALAQKQAPGRTDQIVGSVFLGLFDLQMVLGLLVILLGGLVNAVHPIVMFVAIVSAHVLQMMTKRASSANAQWVRLAFYVVPLAIILVGLATIGRLPI